MDSSRLMTASLRSAAWGEKVARVLAAALDAVEPGLSVSRFVRRSGSQLFINGRKYGLDGFQHIYLVGAGKAGLPMARAVAGILGSYLTSGLIIVKEGYASGPLPDRVEIVEAGHPIPDERGLCAAQRMFALVQSAQKHDMVIFIFSGGGSALMTCPASGITLDDLKVTTTSLLKAGASIQEINAVRKHLETLKGGALASLSPKSTRVALILSDVVGDPLDVIASGPTVGDQTTFSEALAVLEQYDLVKSVPQVVAERLQLGAQGKLPETPKPGDPSLQRVQNIIVGSNRQAAEAALAQAHDEGFHTLLLTTYLQGEARQAGRLLAAVARQIGPDGQPLDRPACLVSGGETTVTVTGNGLGGRNQEVALGAVADLAGLPNMALVTLATDGGDGPTDAAGAVVTGETAERARRLGLDPRRYLARNDSYNFFNALDDLLRPGPTQTNVNDLTFVFAF